MEQISSFLNYITYTINGLGFVDRTYNSTPKRHDNDNDINDGSGAKAGSEHQVAIINEEPKSIYTKPSGYKNVNTSTYTN